MDGVVSKIFRGKVQIRQKPNRNMVHNATGEFRVHLDRDSTIPFLSSLGSAKPLSLYRGWLGGHGGLRMLQLILAS